MRALYLILNPSAGRGRAESAWAAVEPILAATGARWQLARTMAPGEAEALAHAAARAGIWDAVVAIGGDGTVHEVANGLLGAGSGGSAGLVDGANFLDGADSTDVSGVSGQSDGAAEVDGAAVADGPALGIIPAGSGNDFARAVGIPVGDPAAALRAILEGTVRVVDVGRVNGRWFVNGMGWGLDGRVAVQVARRRRFAGRAMYLAALVAALRGQRPAHVDICLDGRTVPGFVTLIAVTNGPCYGGGFRICPHARVDDGQLELCVADAMSRLSILRLVPRVLRGTHLGHPKVWYARGATVTLTSRVGLPAHADGEVIDAGATRLVVEVVAGGVRVVGGGGNGHPHPLHDPDPRV